MLFTLVLTATCFIPVAISIWLVARHDLGVRYIILAITLALGVMLVVQLSVAQLLNPATAILVVIVCFCLYGGWWLSRRVIDSMLEQGGIRARW